jgi:penicillin-binding protein 1A
VRQAIPAPKQVQAPSEQTIEGVEAGYFTSWVQQQIIERYGAPRAFDGGLRIKTTLDLDLQRAAEQSVGAYLANPSGPTASLVAIENSTGEVRAMVGGRNYDESPFNLATNGERQPGSSFKAFDLAAALEDGISPNSVWTSKQKLFMVPGAYGKEKFSVHNDEGAYSGSNTLTGATAFSDNSIYAEVGLKVGTRRIALLAHRMGITTPLSTNAAMTIGGLTVGVTPLDMAHAYETIAHGGRRVTGSMAHVGDPVGIQSVESPHSALPDGSHRDVNRVETKQVLPASIAATETSMLETVLQYGTGRAASIGQFAAGKTGTTSNYGDAWFVGWNSKYTVAVWVGYPDKLIPMTTEFNGQPVLGGTFPALIWRNFILAALGIDKARAEHAGSATTPSTGTPLPSTSTGEGGAATSTTTNPSSQPGSHSTPNAGSSAPAQSAPASEGERVNTTPERSVSPAPSAGEAPSQTTAAPPPPATQTTPTGGVGPGG